MCVFTVGLGHVARADHRRSPVPQHANRKQPAGPRPTAPGQAEGPQQDSEMMLAFKAMSFDGTPIHSFLRLCVSHFSFYLSVLSKVVLSLASLMVFLRYGKGSDLEKI